MKGRFPIGMFVGSAELRDAERRRIGERPAEIGRGRAPQDRRLECLQNRVRVIGEESGG
jgi:hypothetical protein